jgi:nucleoside 2-deoxyribosyltransferase
LAEIRQAQIVVADFTGQRAGVYYEAGFAEGLSIPVIRTCRKDEEEQTKLHFDVNHYPFIFWKDSEDLRKKLKARILARIDKFRGKDRQFKPWEG